MPIINDSVDPAIWNALQAALQELTQLGLDRPLRSLTVGEVQRIVEAAIHDYERTPRKMHSMIQSDQSKLT